ncbi:MAG: hypothetical protein WCI71_00810 [Bacteroidota bacterium]
MKKTINLVCLLTVIGLVINTGTVAMSQTVDKADAASIKARYDVLKNQFDIARYQWYDLYAEGVMIKAGEAGKLLDQAKELTGANKITDADKILDQAEKLLQIRDKSILPVYNATDNIKNPDLSKIRKSTIGDYKARDMYGLLKGDIAIGFVGRGDDGLLYEIMPLLNYHGSGGIVAPVAFEIMRGDEFGKIHMVLIKSQPIIILQTDQSIVFYAEEDGNYQLYSVSRIGDETFVWIEGKGKDLGGVDVAFNVAMKSRSTYWYNQNRPDYVIYPNTSFAGFEEIGPSTGTITIGGKTAKFKNAFGESENLFNGPKPGTDINKISYRKMMTIYGNEWWMPFNSDQLDGFLCFIGASRDFAIFYKGELIVPTDVKITPVVACRSFMVDAKTPKGDLHLKVDCETQELFYYEYGASITGTFAGITLTNGYGSLEKTPLGGMSGVETIDAMGSGKVKVSDVMDNLQKNFPPPTLGADKIGPK